MEKQPSVYKPEFIPYYPAIADKFELNPVETLVYGFIRFYTSSTEHSFYFSNDQIGQMINRKKSQISAAINKLIQVGAISADYQIKATGGQIRYLKVKVGLPEIRKSEVRKTGSQTTEKPVSNKNKVNKNKLKLNNTLPATPVVKEKLSTNGDKSVDKPTRGNGITAIGDLLSKYKITPPAERQRVFTPWQDHALRVAEKLSIKPDSAWFGLFKLYYGKGQAAKLDRAYSRAVDAGARDVRKYFYWAVAH